ncbi:Nucleoside_transporter [Hexamita inflata]|uniref:Nucleoside transporter n=1 Tax=Hexamita inflata TaxID=28002 RepID=A0AA86PIF4_9EUKA|nr:Nucleoside transporter [Hexamita inflata]
MKVKAKEYYYFMVLGFSAILSYYCMMGQTNFWLYFYDNTTITTISMVFTVGEFLGSLAAIILNKKWKTKTFSSVHVATSVVSLAVMLPLTFVQGKTARLVLLCIPVLLSGVTASMFIACVIGLASKFNPFYIQAATLGISVSSIFMSLLQLALSAVFDASQLPARPSNIYNCLVFYVITILIFLYTLLVWKQLNRLIAPEVVVQAEELSQISESASKAELLKDCESVVTDTVEPSRADVQVVETAILEQVVEPEVVQMNPKEFRKAVYPTAIALGINNVITFAMFPLFVSNIPCLSSSCQKSLEKWWNMIFMNLHMLFDLVGKLVPSIKHFKLKLAPGLIMCYCRVLFCVLFVLITLPRNKPVIQSDAASFVIEIAFSLSQSLLYTSCIMQYQDNFTNPLDRQKASFYQNVLYQGGIGLGAIIGVCIKFLFE